MTQQTDFELGEKVAQAIDRANRAAREKAEAAEATQAKERAESVAKHQATIADLHLFPELDGWALIAAASGVWIVLPDCLPIRVHKANGGHLVYEPAARECLESRYDHSPSNPNSWMRCFDIDEAIKKAYEGAEREEREAEDAKMRQEAQEKEWAKYEAPAKTPDERIADALEGLLAAVKKFPVSKLP